ncbi:hypothetical protein CXB51_017958 [Gossypium anomalum]|uniref:Aminotransferase-like plant mobile domain-containing protein n=1 Tax=Gossypium anomalum TaxID=47600 RepID=A0A8J5YY64_9ROSI|nr:hypothetical protein CXB51_017958 [Gossypium anomalum]
MVIGGLLMPDKLRNLVRLRWFLKLVNFKEAVKLSWGSIVLTTLYRETWNHWPSYVGLPDELRDMRLLLDQRSKAKHVKVPLVVYATVEIHKSDRVLRQFRFKQSIQVALQDLEDLHHVDLQERTDENWTTFHA